MIREEVEGMKRRNGGAEKEGLRTEGSGEENPAEKVAEKETLQETAPPQTPPQDPASPPSHSPPPSCPFVGGNVPTSKAAGTEEERGERRQLKKKGSWMGKERKEGEGGVGKGGMERGGRGVAVGSVGSARRVAGVGTSRVAPAPLPKPPHQETKGGTLVEIGPKTTKGGIVLKESPNYKKPKGVSRTKSRLVNAIKMAEGGSGR